MMLPSAPKFKVILQSVIKANRGDYIKILKLGSTMQQIQVLDRGRRTYDPKKGSIYPLLDFLSLFRDNDATDQRDKIYGLLGLPGLSSKTKAESTVTTVTTTAAHNESLGYDPEVLVVDYAAPVQEVYKSLVQAIVLATRKINIICMCQAGGMKDLPTWAPDWSQHWIVGRTGFLQHKIMFAQPEAQYYWNEGTGTDFTASKSSDALVTFSSNLKILRVKGMVVDVIEQCLGRFNTDRKTAETYGKNVRRWRERGVPGIYGSIEAAKEAHWWSLTALSDLRIKGKGTALLLGPQGGVVKREPTLEAWEVEYEDMVVNSGFNIEFVAMCSRTMSGRQTMLGRKGFVVTGPETALAGDLVVVLLGCDIPVLLRKDGDEVRLVGECYCHGIMKGEMMEALDAGTVDLVEFALH
jgi:hypothetical protein